MVERWRGILQACCCGCPNPTRVAASLIVNPSIRTLMKPSSNAILFMGDSVQGTGNPVIEKLSSLENVAEILVAKLGDTANAWVLEASKFQGPFACYEAFIPSLSSCGEPLCYDPEGFPAARAICSLINNCLIKVNEDLCTERKDLNNYGSSALENIQFQGNKIEESEAPIAPTDNIPKTLLFGFSKGGIILNQILAELAQLERQSRTSVDNSQRHAGSGLNGSSLLIHDGYKLWPAETDKFLKSILEIHYVDVGLNCSGAYHTDVSVLENVVKAARSSNSGLHLAFHGTPRQWNDKARYWISSEKDSCIRSLQMAAKRLGSDKIRVTEKLYFAEDRPNLQMHFEILESLLLD